MPFFKKDSKLDWFNYHPIYILSNIEKILEKPIYTRFFNFMTENNIIYGMQFGFS